MLNLLIGQSASLETTLLLSTLQNHAQHDIAISLGITTIRCWFGEGDPILILRDILHIVHHHTCSNLYLAFETTQLILLKSKTAIGIKPNTAFDDHIAITNRNRRIDKLGFGTQRPFATHA